MSKAPKLTGYKAPAKPQSAQTNQAGKEMAKLRQDSASKASDFLKTMHDVQSGEATKKFSVR